MLDSSAILAAILQEPGGELVTDALGGALVSTVNAAEIFAIATRKALSPELVRKFLSYRGIEIVPLSLYDAEVAGRMISLTESAGLSLGDRCCLALALSRDAQVLTADRSWMDFAEPLGLQITLIR